MPERLVLGTRGSALARAQTGAVAEALRRAHPGLEVELRLIRTKGDDEAAPLWAVGGKGLFTRELEEALGRGEIDAAVHSLKDLPTDLPAGFEVACVPVRADPRDVLVTREGRGLADLPAGTPVGTSSLRRIALLVTERPDLAPRNLRGNLDTRLGKVLSGELPAAVVAAAGLARIGTVPAGIRTVPLPPERFVPAAAQGALGIEGRANDPRVAALLAPLADPGTAACVSAERHVLSRLGVGCHVPLGVHVVPEAPGYLLRAFLAHPDGRSPIRLERRGPDPRTLAEEAHHELLDRGGREVIDLVNATVAKALRKDGA